MDGITQFPGQSPEPSPPAPQGPSVPTPAKPSAPSPVPMLPQPQRKTWLWVLLGVVGFVVLVLALLVYYGAPTPEETGRLEDQNLTAIGEELSQVDLDNLGVELTDIEKELQ